MDAKIRVWRCDGCGEMLPGPDLDLDMAKCKCETGRWRVCSVTAAICASMEPVRKAEQDRDTLAAANLAANKRIVELEYERDAAKRQISALENQLVNAAALRIEDEAHCERLIAERDAARAELARLTTPRPIAEAPRDGTWVLLPFSTSKWDACRGPSPQYVTARWFAAAWADPNGALLTEPSHYLPLPEVNP